MIFKGTRMNIEVFTYTWSYYDGVLDKAITGTTQFKVTRAFIVEKERNNLMATRYKIIEGTKEIVDSSLIINGEYHPELRAKE